MIYAQTNAQTRYLSFFFPSFSCSIGWGSAEQIDAQAQAIDEGLI